MIETLTLFEPFPQPVQIPIFDAGAFAYQLARPYPFTVSFGDGPLEDYEVPMGFINDGTSLPWFTPDGIVPRDGLHRAGYVPHDYFYATHIVDRLKADQIFYALMLAAQVEPWRAVLMYNAVRKFGQGPWERAGERGPRIEPPRYIIT